MWSGEKWPEPAGILKTDLTGFPDVLKVGGKEEMSQGRLQSLGAERLQGCGFHLLR